MSGRAKAGSKGRAERKAGGNGTENYPKQPSNQGKLSRVDKRRNKINASPEGKGQNNELRSDTRGGAKQGEKTSPNDTGTMASHPSKVAGAPPQTSSEPGSNESRRAGGELNAQAVEVAQLF